MDRIEIDKATDKLREHIPGGKAKLMSAHINQEIVFEKDHAENKY